MPSDVFIAFVERKLAQHGVRKVVPDDDTMRSHARRVVEEMLAEQALMHVREKMQTEAAAAHLPADLGEQVRSMLADQPDLPWDERTNEALPVRHGIADFLKASAAVRPARCSCCAEARPSAECPVPTMALSEAAKAALDPKRSRWLRTSCNRLCIRSTTASKPNAPSMRWRGGLEPSHTARKW